MLASAEARLRGGSGGTSIATSVQITARNDIALTKKHQPGPTAARVSPAKAGPSDWLSWNWVELIAIAFCRSSFLTRSETIDWRTGALKALTTPFRNEMTMMWVIVSTPL